MNKELINGKPWLDNNGNKIEAHGGSIIKVDDTYYWYGEDKSHTTKKGKIWTYGVHLYSSNDLLNWKDEGRIIEPVLDDKKSIFYPTRRLDRPHMIFNKKTNKYVLWLKYNDLATYTVLTADNIKGPYTLIKADFQPFNLKCGDFDLEVDEKTNEAFIYFETNHDSLRVAQLNEEYTDVIDKCKIIFDNLYPPFAREGVCHFMRNDKHYLITSGMIGYVPNPSRFAVSEDRFGDYQDLGLSHLNDVNCSSFDSQPTDVIYIKEKDYFLLLADRWVPDYPMSKEKYDALVRIIASRKTKEYGKPKFKDFITVMKAPLMGSADTSKSTYVWLNIKFKDDKPYVEWENEWKPL